MVLRGIALKWFLCYNEKVKKGGNVNAKGYRQNQRFLQKASVPVGCTVEADCYNFNAYRPYKQGADLS